MMSFYWLLAESHDGSSKNQLWIIYIGSTDSLHIRSVFGAPIDFISLRSSTSVLDPMQGSQAIHTHLDERVFSQVE